ncbi:MAG: glutamate 5-kinase, partial [Deltaproteobacteria bacterium]
GSALLADENSNLNKKFLRTVAREIVSLEEGGIKCVIVSSGALAAGREVIGLTDRPRKLSLKQAACAVGQPLLMYFYAREFSRYGKQVAQILLTHSDFEERERFLNARNTIFELLAHGVIPIINENDTVATEEIKVGDNDALAVRVTDLVGADLLIMLSESGGLFDRDPARYKNAKRIPLVEKVDESVLKLAARQRGRALGIGGMKSKLLAAQMASFYGIPVVIAGSKGRHFLKKILEGEDDGTLFIPSRKKERSRRYWIAYALTPKGTIVVDEGARKALEEDHRSLLPRGIVAVKGTFGKGAPVLIEDEKGTVFAKGISSIDSETIEKIKRKKSSEIKKIYGSALPEEVVHADNLSILPKVPGGEET